MPNAHFIQGSPIAEATKGFDRPEELYCLIEPGRTNPSFIGYAQQCDANAEHYPEAKMILLSVQEKVLKLAENAIS